MASTRQMESDENTPLLKGQADKKKPRLPYKQLAILALCRIADPLSLTSIFSYLPQMLRSFGVGEADIGFWAGIISASLALCQCLTGVFWGRLSDKIGRKPSMIIGLCAMVFSQLLFGFSRSITVAIIARCGVGLVGNVAILRTTVAELVTDPDLKLQALAILPMAWNVGTISGPALGGLLSEPSQKYPSLFPKGSFFDQNPWALPNIVIAALMVTGAILATLFLDETLEQRRYARDRGRELGKKIESLFGFSCSEPTDSSFSKSSVGTDEESLLEDSRDDCYKDGKESVPLPWSEILTPQSTYLVILFFLAAIHRVTAEQLLSLFFATRLHRKSDPTRLPFHIPGGFGLNSSQIGLIFAANGVAEILIQIFLYTPLARKYGNRKLLMIAAITDPIVYFMIPYLLVLYDPESGNNAICYTLWATALFMISLNSVLGLNSVIILVTNSASSPKALATLNGLATSTVAFGIAIGPSAFGWLYSVGQKTEWTTIPWVGLTIVALSMWIWIPMVKDLKASSDEESGDTSKSGNEHAEERE